MAAAKLPRYDNPNLRTAHHVRTMCVCSACGGLGNTTDMLRETPFGAAQYQHGRCFIALHGLAAFLKLPKSQTDEMTLGDIGTDAMRALLDRDTGAA